MTSRKFLEELFRTHHALLAVSNMATMGHQIYGKMVNLARFVPPRDSRSWRTSRTSSTGSAAPPARPGICRERIDFYQARTNTQVTIAAERLALIAAVTLPSTALSSIYGMNVIVNDPH